MRVEEVEEEQHSPFNFFVREEPKKEEYVFHTKEEAKVEETKVVTADDLSMIANERMRKLKNLSMKLNNPSGMAEMETEPAFKRRNIQLNSTPVSSESNYSKYTFSTDDDNKGTEIRRNNSFLHDNVD